MVFCGLIFDCRTLLAIEKTGSMSNPVGKQNMKARNQSR